MHAIVCVRVRFGRSPEQTKVRAVVVDIADHRNVGAAKAVNTRRALSKAWSTRAQRRLAFCVGLTRLAIRHLQRLRAKMRQATAGGIKGGEGFHELIYVRFHLRRRAVEVEEYVAILGTRIVNLAVASCLIHTRR